MGFQTQLLQTCNHVPQRKAERHVLECLRGAAIVDDRLKVSVPPVLDGPLGPPLIPNPIPEIRQCRLERGRPRFVAPDSKDLLSLESAEAKPLCAVDAHLRGNGIDLFSNEIAYALEHSRRGPSYLFQQITQVLAVAALFQGLRPFEKLIVVNPPLPPGHLFHTGNLQALPALGNLDEP